jgi:hypothetical protein
VKEVRLAHCPLRSGPCAPWPWRGLTCAGLGVQAQVAEELGIPVKLQRYWVWAKRQNKTTRPNRPLSAAEEAQTVQQLKDSHMKSPLTELRLFLEAPILREVSGRPEGRGGEDDWSGSGTRRLHTAFALQRSSYQGSKARSCASLGWLPLSTDSYC